MQRKIYGFVLMAVLGLSLSSLLTATETPRPATSPLPAVRRTTSMKRAAGCELRGGSATRRSPRANRENAPAVPFHDRATGSNILVGHPKTR